MIEAVNSVIANASLVRSISAQSDNARQESAAVSSDASHAAAPVAPYISPYIEVDEQYDTAVLQIRDSDTGDVLRQFPSEGTLQARQRVESIRQSAETARQASASVSDQQGASSSSSSSQLFAVADSSVSSSSRGGAAVSVASTPASVSSSVNSADAQIASAALNAGAQTAQPVSSSVSVTA